MRIVESPNCYKLVEDWSRVRSPGRARRRMAQGHRQNIGCRQQPEAVTIGGVVFCHPAIYAELRKQTATLERSYGPGAVNFDPGDPVVQQARDLTVRAYAHFLDNLPR
jgi:hypothetical protein